MFDLTAAQGEQLANNGITLESLGNQPDWLYIDDIATIHAIQQGGCASGAYMDAVTYCKAIETMGKHGEDITDYIDSVFGEVPEHDQECWSQICTFYYSLAVETWCSQFDLDGVDWD